MSFSLNSGSFTSSLIHKGGVSRICALNDKGDYVSVSRYGEITQWNYASGKWDKQLLSSNSACSYRDVCIDDDGVIYALSYNGLLQSVVGKQVAQPITLPESKGWTRVIPIGNNQILLSSASSLYLFDTVSRSVVASIQVPQEITSLGKKDDRIMVFGKNGGIWSIGKDAKLRAEEINLRGVVTAFTFDDEKNLSAIGLENGDIVVIDANGNSRGKLVGHSSRVTDLHFVGNFLFSSSYDRVVNIWDVNATNGEAVSIKDFTSWVYCICSNDKKALFIGEQSGKVSRIVVSPSEMAKTIHSNLKRDFTDDEWEYYVGKNVPRIKLKN